MAPRLPNRAEQLALLRDSACWDVVIIGGGASGLGAAVDAAARGYRTLLIERLDFASGTSSRSTKLIHGGVRYLRQGNLALVRDALRERANLLHNAPHLVHPLAFIIPAGSQFERLFYGRRPQALRPAGRQPLHAGQHLARPPANPERPARPQ
jgi:glycerol-3-phosphate dehydrogenase